MEREPRDTDTRQRMRLLDERRGIDDVLVTGMGERRETNVECIIASRLGRELTEPCDRVREHRDIRDRRSVDCGRRPRPRGKRAPAVAVSECTSHRGRRIPTRPYRWMRLL